MVDTIDAELDECGHRRAMLEEKGFSLERY
jgi:hypothetical protein